jgi:hypothetical protein
MTALKWPNKDPDEVTDFICDWSERLLNEVIAISVWLVPSGITKNSDMVTNGATLLGLPNRYWTTIWLAGGVQGTTYSFVNRITTSGGRVYDQTLKLRCKTR